MQKLVLIRHGESQWNMENRFTGWQDIDLSERGRAEALEAGRLLREGGYVFYRLANPKILRACRLMREVLMEGFERAGELWRLERQMS